MNLTASTYKLQNQLSAILYVVMMYIITQNLAKIC